MAQSRSASGTKKEYVREEKARKPIRREVGSVVCLALGLFTLIGYFVRDYWLIDWLCLYVFKGLFGWGFLSCRCASSGRRPFSASTADAL